MGVLYLDLLRRGGKLGGAAHFTVQCGRGVPGVGYRSPVVALVCNFGDGGEGTTAKDVRLSHQEVETLFHEFGHVVHAVLGRTHFQHLSGTRTAMDVVELPSTLMEYFASDPDVLQACGRHYLTGAPLPREVAEDVKRNKAMFAGLDTMQQVVYSALDLELHAELTNLGKAGWSRHVADEVLHRHSPLAHGAPGGEQGDWHAHFSHLGSYGANYYSYLSSRVLSAAIWARLFAQDPLKEGAGAALVDEFLLHGGARHPRLMIQALLGPPSDAPGFQQGKKQHDGPASGPDGPASGRDGPTSGREAHGPASETKKEDGPASEGSEAEVVYKTEAFIQELLRS